MRTRLLILAIIGIVGILAVIFHTELLGENATYGQCIISAFGNNGGHSSKSSIYENQCKQSCVSSGNSEVNKNRNVSCKFETISGYGWVTSPKEFEYMIDKLSLNPSH
jgi:hypothetical protein